MKKYFLFAICAALTACSSQPISTPRPEPSLTPTLAAPTATLEPPSATPVPPSVTSTRVSPTLTPTLTATRAIQSIEPPPVSVTQILSPAPNLITATYTARGGQTIVELNVAPSAATIAQTALIYERACSNPGITRYPLTNLVNGKSTTTVNVSFTVLLSGVLILDIKKSTQPGDASVACAVIPEVWVNELKEGSQPGTLVAFDQAGGTEVDLFIKPGSPGMVQPAFLREGSCNNLGALRYSLNPVVDGVSKTFFGTRFGEFKRERGVWQVLKSVNELDVTVTCSVVVRPD